MQENALFPNVDIPNLLISNLNEKLISKIHKEVKRQHSICGVWSDQENLIYAQFIQDHPFEFETPEKRRRYKVFERMAMKLPNRTAIQCRSHNQKLVKLAGGILNVPRYIKRRLSPKGRKSEKATYIKEQQEKVELNEEQEKVQVEQKNCTQQVEQSEKSGQKEVIQSDGGWNLPIKLCIQIKGDNMEEY